MFDKILGKLGLDGGDYYDHDMHTMTVMISMMMSQGSHQEHLCLMEELMIRMIQISHRQGSEDARIR